jgi:hypothetical protein
LFGEFFAGLSGEAIQGLTSSELQEVLGWADTGIQTLGQRNEWRIPLQEARSSLESQEILRLKAVETGGE